MAARYGGEEFVILLPETPKANAVICAENLREFIAEHPFSGRETQPLGTVSVSIGISCYPDDGKDLSLLIQSADEALYRAKAAGRNRIFEAESSDNS